MLWNVPADIHDEWEPSTQFCFTEDNGPKRFGSRLELRFIVGSSTRSATSTGGAARSNAEEFNIDLRIGPLDQDVPPIEHVDLDGL